VPEEFGPYLLEEEIGRGGMGVVFRAYDTRRDRQVAIKRLPRDLSADETFQARFRRESRLAARLNEPHIIPIHDFGEIDGVLYLDMRLVEGTDLSSLISSRTPRLTPTLAVDIIGQVAAALTSAHEAGLVHRDVKPSNVLISGLDDDEDAFAYLVDFGIARGQPGSEGTALTTNSETVGTLGYMAPERISGASGDYRSDIYSLACMLYECLTGRTPFPGESFQVMYAHVNNAPPLPSAARPGLPAAIDAVVARGMAKDPAARYASARQLASAARAALAARPSMPVPPIPPSAPLSGPGIGPGIGHTPPPRAPSQPAWSMAPTAFQRPPMTGPAPPPPPQNWSGGAAHPSGPLPRPPTTSSPPPKRSRRTLIAAVIAAVVVLGGGIGIAVAVTGGDSPTPSPTSTAPSPLPSTTSTHDFPTSSAPSSTGAAATAADWADFDDFTNVVGRSDGDTTASFMHAFCALHGSDGTPGMVDRVECTLANSLVTFSVARFSGASALSTYLDQLTSAKGYQVGFWTLPKVNDDNRGRLYSSPVTASFVDVTSSICALPTYIVRFFVPPGSSLTVQDIKTDYWKNAQFPDSVPAPCK
jgi:serine/threonine protein kinase